jgi:hypothetical protein
MKVCLGLYKNNINEFYYIFLTDHCILFNINDMYVTDDTIFRSFGVFSCDLFEPILS